MEYVGKVGKRKIYLGNGDTIERVVRLGIPEAIVVYKRDWRSEIGYLYIYLKKGNWKIWYGSESFSYNLAGWKWRNIGIDVKRTFREKDEKTGEYKERTIEWLVADESFGSKVITHSINEAENAEELIEPKSTQSITKPEVKLEYYEKNKILKIPFFIDELRLNVKNGYLEFIRNNRKIIEILPFKKEMHYYGSAYFIGSEFKVIAHPKIEGGMAKRLIEKEIIKPIPESKLEYYRNNKILKLPFNEEEIRIDIENKNIEYISRYGIKRIEIFLLNKEIHYYNNDFKVIIHPIEKIKKVKEESVIKPEIIKSIPENDLEYYKENDILRVPILKDEIRMNIENENLEFIRNNKNIVKAYPLNKELHFYGIKPEVWRYIVTPRGDVTPANTTNWAYKES